jgi:hypothetical protein
VIAPNPEPAPAAEGEIIAACGDVNEDDDDEDMVEMNILGPDGTMEWNGPRVSWHAR